MSPHSRWVFHQIHRPAGSGRTFCPESAKRTSQHGSWTHCTQLNPLHIPAAVNVKAMLRSVDGCIRRPLACVVGSPSVRLGLNPLRATGTGVCRSKTDGRNTREPPKASVMEQAQHRARLYSQLSKYRLSALVMATTSAGYLAAGGPVDAASLSCACLGTMLASSSANTFNQVIETSNDTRMKRTRNRPLPSGRISRPHALGWGVASGTSGVAVLAAGSNPITAALGAANLVLYVGPYTLSKTRSELNTWIGSIVGAVPPLMGWAAATGGVAAVEPLLLATYLFVWQFPHFFSLAWLHREDYARGGFKMVRYYIMIRCARIRIFVIFSSVFDQTSSYSRRLGKNQLRWFFAGEGRPDTVVVHPVSIQGSHRPIYRS